MLCMGLTALKHVGSSAPLVAQMVKTLPAMQETWVRSLSWEDPLEKGMAAHSSILAWRIPWAEKLGRLYSPWGRKESDTTEQLSLTYFVRSKFLNQGSNPCLCTVRWTPNHWVTREVPCLFQFSLFPFLCVLSSLLMIWHRGHAC